MGDYYLFPALSAVDFSPPTSSLSTTDVDPVSPYEPPPSPSPVGFSSPTSSPPTTGVSPVSPNESPPPHFSPSPTPSPISPPGATTMVPAPGSTTGKPTTTVTPPPVGGLATGTLAAIVAVTVTVLVAAGIFVVFYKRRRRKLAAQNPRPHEPQNDPFAGPPQHRQQNAATPSSIMGSDKLFPPPSPAGSLGKFNSTFTYEELKTATDDFSDANLLGKGGFGYVHKGVLADGKVVAIKQLKAGSHQGEREFQAEIEIISRIHHRNLLSLLGYCIFGAQRLLVYEFVPNKTLDFHLHRKTRPVMDWRTRMKIALGSARGLAYLHEDCQPKIIHRDIKSANILLDNSFEAKVADFGLARYFSDTDTHVSTRVMGTFGYLAPEYASSGKLTEKSDVYSFGVLLLELITGLRPTDETLSFPNNSMVDWAKPLLAQALADSNFDALADSKLQEYDSAEMARMAACAAASVRHSASSRPRMSQIVRALEGNMPTVDMNDGIPSGQSSDYNSMQRREDTKKFKKMALESAEPGSSDYSGVTSSFSLNPSGSSTEDRQTTQEIEPLKAEKRNNVTSESS